MRYSILMPPAEERFCAITKWPEGMRNPARPARGDSLKGTYKSVLDLKMSVLIHPQGIQVPDLIYNAMRWLLVSERLKALLERHAATGVEFLPFRLINHKGRVAAERVYAANVLGTVNCGDRKRSAGTDSEFDEGEFFECDRLGIDERKVPRGLKIFRTSLFPPLVLVREDLRARIEEEEMVLRFVAPGEPLE